MSVTDSDNEGQVANGEYLTVLISVMLCGSDDGDARNSESPY